jgi:hypothetical protein
MEAKELRIGNYIDTGEFHIERARGIYKYNPSWYKYVHMFRPIPLTEEWLLKFGFEKPAHIWCGDKFHLTNYDRDHSLWCVAMNKNNAIIANIRYLHQLQNLYFALTGEELTLNEKQDA